MSQDIQPTMQYIVWFEFKRQTNDKNTHLSNTTRFVVLLSLSLYLINFSC